jgi:hypothetical protein
VLAAGSAGSCRHLNIESILTMIAMEHKNVKLSITDELNGYQKNDVKEKMTHITGYMRQRIDG